MTTHTDRLYAISEHFDSIKPLLELQGCSVFQVKASRTRFEAAAAKLSKDFTVDYSFVPIGREAEGREYWYIVAIQDGDQYNFPDSVRWER